MAPTYATREQVAAASDVRASAYLDGTLDRLIEQASRTIERRFHRKFYPTIATKVIEWPDRGSLWVEDDLLSVSSLLVDGITETDYTLEPSFYGAPYNRIDLDRTGELVSITGVWGFSNDTVPAGSLSAAVVSTSATTIVVTNSALVGVGDQLLVDSERMVVTGKQSSTTGTTLTSDVGALASVVTVPVASGAAVAVGERVTVDAERMAVLDVVGNNLLVRRAVDGSTLAAHSSGATVYAGRTLTVTRGDAGTTAATHLISAPLVRNLPPGLITELCIAEVQSTLGQEQAAWNLTIGEGEGQRESSGKSLGNLKNEAARLYRRGRYGRAV